MSVYKPFTTSDVIVTPFKVNKSFSFYGKTWKSSIFNGREELIRTQTTIKEWVVDEEGEQYLKSTEKVVGADINRYLGVNYSTTPFISGSYPTGADKNQNQELVYNSIKQLYYTNYIRGKNGSTVLTSSLNIDGTTTGQSGIQPSYNNYLSNTLLANRFFPTSSNSEIGVISIASEYFGEYIKPSSFKMTVNGSTLNGFVGTIRDDGEGNLLLSGTSYNYNNDGSLQGYTDSTTTEVKVGNIIYEHGIAIITNSRNLLTSGSRYGSGNNLGYGTARYDNPYKVLDSILKSDNVRIDFSSTRTIYESQYKCTFNPNEFIFSQNPTIISGSCNNLEGKLNDFATGSYFEPYITSVGLYNNENQLIAVGKLSQPLPSSNVTDTTILVNLDL